MHHHLQAVLSLTALRLVREAVVTALETGHLTTPLWVDQDETLLDRLDLVIDTLGRTRFPLRSQAEDGTATLHATRQTLELAERTGALRGVLWASVNQTLLDYVDGTLGLLGAEVA